MNPHEADLEKTTLPSSTPAPGTPSTWGRNLFFVFCGLSLLIGVCVYSVYFLTIKAPLDAAERGQDMAGEAIHGGYDLATRVGQDLSDFFNFQPEITVGSTTVFEPATQIEELTLAQKTFTHEVRYETTWLGSTKTLVMRGTFRAKAGVPINDDFRIQIAPGGDRLTIFHSPVELLSCELQDYKIVSAKAGWWNKISDEEKEDLTNRLTAEARNLALDRDLVENVGDNLLDRLKPLQEQTPFEATTRTVP